VRALLFHNGTPITSPTIDAAAPPLRFSRPTVADKDKARQLSEDRRHVRRTDKAVMLDARRLANAIEHIGRLPEPGEAFHMVCEKKYSMMHVVPATLHLAEPVTIRYLAVVTLSFSSANMIDLLAMLDAGQIEKVDFPVFGLLPQQRKRELPTVDARN